jgi:DUF4097 and DUF4098 domain-containing protein YvlB
MVRTHAGKDVIVETGHGAKQQAPEEARGMRRLNLPSRGLEVEEQDNVIQVRFRSAADQDVLITVPPDTSLSLKSTNGSVEAEGVRGEVDADSHNGRVTLTNISGTVVAHSLNGQSKVVLDRVDPGKPLSFSTLNGSIDVTLPADTKANVKFKADRGEVYSDFDIALAPSQAVSEKSDGRFRVRIDRTIQGTINGGGVEMAFYTLNGKIYLRKH